jgi:hypothetical protein
MFDLDRFHRAQDSGGDGFANALRELRARRKTGEAFVRWLKYVSRVSPIRVMHGAHGRWYERTSLLLRRLPWEEWLAS